MFLFVVVFLFVLFWLCCLIAWWLRGTVFVAMLVVFGWVCLGLPLISVIVWFRFDLGLNCLDILDLCLWVYGGCFWLLGV